MPSSASKFSEKVLVSSCSIKTRIFDWIQKFIEYGTVQNLNAKGLRYTYSGRTVSAGTQGNTQTLTILHDFASDPV